MILKRMRSMQAVVFVDTAKDVHGHFVGMCASDVIRWRLARAYPKLEVALANGEIRAWSQFVVSRGPFQTQPPIDNDQGRFVDSNNAAELLRGFLGNIQVPVPPPNDPGPWEQLSPGRFEYAQWLNAPLVEKLFADVLDVAAMSFDAFRLADRSTRARLVVEHPRAWLPLVRADGRFQGLINRARVEQAVAVGMVASA
ncbi:hypothetical protein ACN28E_39945 [Archangium lansingense]|uniref:hypothetical protein n=1 Tax=Archangium lansingense TaxID=2995310 RepID=UPI003B7AD501